MSYTVQVRGGQIYALDEADGFDLKVKWLEAEKPFKCELGDDTITSGQIMKITRNRPTQADIPSFTQQRLGAGQHCKAQYSIQLEINRMAKDLSGRESEDNPNGSRWSKLISDQDWRAMMYAKLRETGAQWCDDKRKECACDGAYIPQPGRHNV